MDAVKAHAHYETKLSQQVSVVFALGACSTNFHSAWSCMRLSSRLCLTGWFLSERVKGRSPPPSLTDWRQVIQNKVYSKIFIPRNSVCSMMTVSQCSLWPAETGHWEIRPLDLHGDRDKTFRPIGYWHRYCNNSMYKLCQFSSMHNLCLHDSSCNIPICIHMMCSYSSVPATQRSWLWFQGNKHTDKRNEYIECTVGLKCLSNVLKSFAFYIFRLCAWMCLGDLCCLGLWLFGKWDHGYTVTKRRWGGSATQAVQDNSCYKQVRRSCYHRGFGQYLCLLYVCLCDLMYTTCHCRMWVVHWLCFWKMQWNLSWCKLWR